MRTSVCALLLLAWESTAESSVKSVAEHRDLWSTDDYTYPDVPSVCETTSGFMAAGPMAMLDRVLDDTEYDMCVYCLYNECALAAGPVTLLVLLISVSALIDTRAPKSFQLNTRPLSRRPTKSKS